MNPPDPADGTIPADSEAITRDAPEAKATPPSAGYATVYSADIIEEEDGGAEGGVGIRVRSETLVAGDGIVRQPAPTAISIGAQHNADFTVRCALSPAEAGAARQASLARPEGESGRFADEGQIAHGGMGAIHRVFDKRMLRYEAIKVLDERCIGDAVMAARFVEEAQITGQLDHPNIVPVYDLRIAEGELPTAFAMKLIHGRTLGALMDSLGDARMDEPHLARLVETLATVCDAVAFAHSRGVTHCDLKPENIMVCDFGQVYVMDWGLATIMKGKRPSEEAPEDDRMPVSVDSGASVDTSNLGTRIRGTPAYMAPEQAWGELDQLDERTDVFGLGGVLYRILTLRAPYDDRSLAGVVRKARKGQVTEPQKVVPDRELPPELCRIALRALAREKESRYPSVLALKDDLNAFLHGGGWFETRHVTEGEHVVTEGERGECAYIIVSGECEAYKNIDGKRNVLRHMGPGEVFGETAVLTAQPRTASVIALSDMVVKIVTRASLDRELTRNPWLGSFVRVLAQRFRERDAELSSVRQALNQSRSKGLGQQAPPHAIKPCIGGGILKN